MERDETRRAVTVGIFIILGLLVFVLGIFTLGGQKKTFANNIHVSAVFDDVAGLKKGNAVWFSGVNVGTISSIKFTNSSQVEVQMNIDEKVQSYIHRNATVKLSSDGLIGNKIIVIDGGSPQAPMVEDGAVLQAEKLLSTDDIMKTLQQNNQNLLAITADFKKISSNIARGKGLVGALMTDSLMALKFKSIVTNLDNTTASTMRMANELNRFGDKLNTKGGLADKMLTDTSVFAQLKASVAKLKQTANSASELTENLNRASNKLNTTDNVIGVLLNDPKQAAQVKSTLDYLNQSVVKLNDDLEAAQHNFLLKGFFKDRAKAQKKAQEAAAKQ
ncbi:ABC transporter permease [Mucilaginibacter sp. PPCGB 2223]|uniref:MlaD family protein n=1 Tax=Mucilaginibacter sp. PPCGB 2223 TaxID=1886027 RepID=UPI0008256732|nr:MlaD family protein [Mucilaginibacter sp. PPCGB 2223]OCX54155.1 ABC transporter permease [Mucilaginibacter sp. PPCGB 2223]